MLIVFLPVAIRNKLVIGEFVLTTSRAGINFYWGNNESTTGSSFPAPEFVRATTAYELDDFAREAESLNKRRMTNSEVSRFWFKKGLEFILENPGHYLQLQFQKLRLLFNRAEYSDNYQYYYYLKFSPFLSYLPASFWLIGALGLTGMVLSIKKWRRLSLLYLFIICYSGSIILFFVVSRFRLPMTPILSIFAASALYWFWERIAAKKYLALLYAAILLALFVSFVGKDIPWLTKVNAYEVLYLDATGLAQAGNYEVAVAKYTKALMIDSEAFGAHVGLGDAYMKLKQSDKAIIEYKAAAKDYPTWPSIHNKLGMAYFSAGRIDEAAKEFQEFKRLNGEL